MIPVIAVHGHCLGGWCWDPLAEWFASLGFELHAPTLSAPGHTHLAGEPPGAIWHVAQVVAALRAASQPVVLIGSSYGGAVATAAAAAEPQRIRQLVIVDGIVPIGRQSPMEAFPPLQLLYDAAVAASPDGVTLGPPDPAAWGIQNTELANRLRPLLRPVHVRTCTDQLKAPVDVLRRVPGHLLPATDPYRHHAETVRSALGWPCDALPIASHLAMLTHPEALASALLPVLLPRLDPPNRPATQPTSP